MDSESSFVTTYSQDERIAKYLKKKKASQLKQLRALNAARKKRFDHYSATKQNDQTSIFNLKGINFLKFTSTRVKFSFQPSLLARVSEKTIFYVSLQYRNNCWRVKRDSIPVNYKLSVYSIFNIYSIDDSEIILCIRKIWNILYKWALEEAEFRKSKFKRFQEGKDVYIDEDDEELFFTPSEREQRLLHRQNVLQRMLPPLLE